MTHPTAAAAEAALRRGDLLVAHDLCASALANGEDEERLRYLRVLALARMGDTASAMALYTAYRLDESRDVDSLALHGRLLKDAALTAAAALRPSLLAQASEAYKQAAEATGHYFPLVNAATLALLAGDQLRGEHLAAAVLAHPKVGAAADYFAAASAAEAHLVLGDTRAAAAELTRAAGFGSGDQGAHASTRRQIGLIADSIALAAADRAALLEPLSAPTVIAFTGHMFRSGDKGEARMVMAIDALLDRLDARVGYGALACGADLLFAEALLRRGGELNVILPFPAPQFEAHSVAPGGAEWLPRFQACLQAAASVDLATSADYVGDDNQFAYGSLISMGLARLRARHLGAAVRQVAVWDGAAGSGPAGTGADVETWRGYGGESEILAPDGLDRRLERPMVDTAIHRREMCAMVFSDFAGFSRLGEAALPTFWREIMGRAGEALAVHGDKVAGVNTWGDALFAYTTEAVAAAELALNLQAAISQAPLAALGLGEGAGMRFAVHFGPVFRAVDPVTRRDNIFGAEVTRTARIEPITPTGEVYVTQQFAAMLAMAAPERFATSYVGRVKLAKNYGELKMFKLSRVA